MANIGDLYYAFRGDGTRLQADAKVEGAKAGKQLGTSITAGIRQSFTGANLGKGLVQGLGLAGALSGFTLVSRAVGGFVDLLGDASKAAEEDQVSQQKLRTALEASIPGWNGNTDAIEKTLAARMRLGFSDDEQREGLATLVTATHDYTKALELERGAMDISRKRNVSLTDASDALAKAYAGNTKGLKSLIPGLKLGATAAETIANAFKAAGDGAEDYLGTDAGKRLAVQTKFNEALEDLGYKILPLVTGGFEVAAGLLDGLSGSTKDNIEDIERQSVAFENNNGTLEDAIALRERLLAQRKEGVYTDSETKSLNRSQNALDRFIGNAQSAQGAAATAANVINERMDSLDPKPIQDMTDATHGFKRASEEAARAVPKSWQTIIDEMTAKLDALQTQFFDPLAAKEAQLEANRALRAGIEAERTAKTSTEHHDAAIAIQHAIDDEITALGDLQAAGNLTGKDVDKVQKDAAAGFKALGEKVPKDLQKIIDGWHDVAALPKINLNISAPGLHGIVQDYNSLTGNHHSSEKPETKAAGGHVPKNTPFISQEHGFEAIVPWDAYVMGHTQSASMVRDMQSGASGGETNFNFTVAATSPARKPADIIREARIAARDGSLDPRRR